MTVLLAGLALVASLAAGVLTRRHQGWTAELQGTALVTLTVPWLAQHASIARLARSPSLNPLRTAGEAGSLLAPDLAAPALVILVVAACVVWPRRLRLLAVVTPVLAMALTWWVTLPLYAGRMLRGWFFLTEGLAGPWPFTFGLAATAFLAGYALTPGDAGSD